MTAKPIADPADQEKHMGGTKTMPPAKPAERFKKNASTKLALSY